MITIQRIDHIVLTLAEIPSSCHFFNRVLSMEVVTFGGGGRPFVVEGKRSTCTGRARVLTQVTTPDGGFGRLCLTCDATIHDEQQQLGERGVETIEVAVNISARRIAGGPCGRFGNPQPARNKSAHLAVRQTRIPPQLPIPVVQLALAHTQPDLRLLPRDVRCRRQALAAFGRRARDGRGAARAERSVADTLGFHL